MQDAVQAIGAGGGGGDRRLRPHSYHQQALKCLNTKFCYYNNYNLSQPRHFCKSCRRYWTKGGVLRNVPVGGGCRKAKRSSSAKSKKGVNDTVPIQRPECRTKRNTTDLASSTETSTMQHEEGDTTTSSSARDEAGLLVSTDHQDQETTETAQHGLNIFTACMTKTLSEDLIGFSHDHMDPKTSSSCGEEFKVVDYGDTGLFDLTAVIDPSYWNDQSSSLHFLP